MLLLLLLALCNMSHMAAQLPAAKMMSAHAGAVLHQELRQTTREGS